MTNEGKYSEERAANRANMHTISIQTRVPSKWRFVDMETGQVWQWQNDKFTAAHDIKVESQDGEMIAGQKDQSDKIKDQIKELNELLEHVLGNVVKPTELVEQLQKAGVKVEIGVAYVGDKEIDGWSKVECEKCGATAMMPDEQAEKIKSGSATTMCPDCQEQVSQDMKYKDFDPSEFD